MIKLINFNFPYQNSFTSYSLSHFTIFFSIHHPWQKMQKNEFVGDGMLCFAPNPYHWQVVLFTVLPTQPCFDFSMHCFKHPLRSRMIDSYPFRSMSISLPILEIRLFQNLTLKLQGKGHGCDQRASSYGWSSIYLICFLFVTHQPDSNSCDTAILKFNLEKSKVKVMGAVIGRGHIVDPESNRCTSFSFHVNRTNHSWDMSNIECLTLKKHIQHFEK